MMSDRKISKPRISDSGVDLPRDQAVVVIGHLPDEPDAIPVTPPAGFIWMVGGRWWGEIESYGIADVRISIAGETLDFTITLEDAKSLHALLEQTIEDMRQGFSSGAE
ncbi:hypothetical protein [Paracoccus sp. (in: a-proteobacteria)]|uniref:hypothetical protein n=1 Tax=Paracoccus sp. TaxID=267 RepID=UPI0028B0FC57|nr:hypothetical protein [Paracoccus sp. (in: a-proteobacteria)]